MRIFPRGGRHRRRLSRVLPAVGLVLALITGGTLAATSYAGESDGPGAPVLHAPKGYEVTDPAAASSGTAPPSPDGGPTVTPHIIGGAPAAQSSAPWMVQLLFDLDRDGSLYFTCGGTLVAPNKVLTAAHCLHDDRGVRQDWGRYGAVLAGTSKLLGGPGHTEGRVVDVTRSWVRSGYSTTTFNNDIALLTLAKPLAYTTLPMADTGGTALYAAGTKGTAYGWGVTGSDPDSAQLSSTLLGASLPVNSDARCTENLDGILGAGAFKKGNMVCAGQLGTGDDATGVTTCPGDSGGPLVVNGKVAGVVSWGVGSNTEMCNLKDTYEVFTRTGTYAPTVKPRIDDTDLSRNGKADLFARASSGGKGYRYDSTGTGFGARKTFPGSWGVYNVILQTDLNRDGHQDFVVRSRETGHVYWRHRTASSSTYTNTRIADNWKTRKFIVVPGDVTGDRYPDMLSVDSAGRLWVYPGKGDGRFGARIAGGTGYQVYNSLRGKGDFTGDGRADLIARGSGGLVHLLKGTGKASAPFSARIKVRDWDDYNAYAAPGDVTGDGRADFAARTPGGTLYLYPGTGRSDSGIFATRVKIGTGFQQYSTFG